MARRFVGHKGWVGDIEETQGTAVSFPILADPGPQGVAAGQAYCGGAQAPVSVSAMACGTKGVVLTG